MKKVKLCFTCPLCGHLAFIEQLDKEHKFPRVVFKTFKGFRKIEHQDVEIDDIKELVVDKIVSRCVEILEKAGYEVKLVRKHGG